MNKPKTTFIDPVSGEEMESTTLARWGALLVSGLILLPVLLVILVAFVVMALLSFVPLEWDVKRLFGLADRASSRVHRWILQQQNRRQQRLHQRKLWNTERLRQRKFLEAEWAGVPDRAISRSQSPGQPEPTPESLSRARTPETESQQQAHLTPDRRQRILDRLNALGEIPSVDVPELTTDAPSQADTPGEAAPRLTEETGAVKKLEEETVA